MTSSLNQMVYSEIISQELVLRGIRHLCHADSDMAFVIIHGYFSSNKIGPHRLYVKIADYLAKHYGDCYRFDLSGMGESDGDICRIAFNDHVADVVNILSAISKECKPENTIIIAHCIGCDLVLDALEHTGKIYREVIFLTPYFTNKEIISRFFTQGEICELNQQGYTFRKGLFSERSFFYDNTDIERFLRVLSQGKNYFNILAATDDQFIPHEFNEYIRNSSKNATFRYLEGADHNFLTTQTELIDSISQIISDANCSNFDNE